VEAIPQEPVQAKELKLVRLLNLIDKGDTGDLLVEFSNLLDENENLRRRIRGQRHELRRFNREVEQVHRAWSQGYDYAKYTKMRNQLCAAFGSQAVYEAEYPEVKQNPSHPHYSKHSSEVVWWNPFTWRHDA